jgi:hypothetical protein
MSVVLVITHPNGEKTAKSFAKNRKKSPKIAINTGAVLG